MLLISSRDLRALDTQPGHQAALVKGEGVDAAMHGVVGEAASHSFVHDDDARALTTFGKTSTASARDDTLAAAEFCDLSWLRAARDSLVKLPNAVSDVSNTASINATLFLYFDRT